MAKTKRILTGDIKKVDVLIELLDARIPCSSKNPDFQSLSSAKPRIIVLNKSDLADDTVNTLWKKHFLASGSECIFVDTLKGKGLNEVKTALRTLMKDKIEKSLSKGRLIREIRTMVVGIPNVGKSTFINKIAGRNVATTSDRPGVTRNNQWVRINEEIELLDTPGVLWPKFEDPITGINLASTGAIKDTVFDTAEVCAHLLEILKVRYGMQLINRYKLEDLDGGGHSVLEAIGRKRGCIVQGGSVDLYRTSAIILDEFRAGKIGKISLELPS